MEDKKTPYDSLSLDPMKQREGGEEFLNNGTTQKMVEGENYHLIHYICVISTVIAVSQIVPIDFFYRTLDVNHKHIMDKALQICKDKGVINGEKQGYVYQTISAEPWRRTSDELFKAIKLLPQPPHRLIRD